MLVKLLQKLWNNLDKLQIASYELEFSYQFTLHRLDTTSFSNDCRKQNNSPIRRLKMCQATKKKKTVFKSVWWAKNIFQTWHDFILLHHVPKKLHTHILYTPWKHIYRCLITMLTTQVTVTVIDHQFKFQLNLFSFLFFYVKMFSLNRRKKSIILFTYEW